MPCAAYSRTGRPITIKWQDAGGSIISSNPSNLAVLESNTTRGGVYVAKSILAIKCASFEDAMQYMCVATDGIEFDYAGFNLHFTCKCESHLNNTQYQLTCVNNAVGPIIKPINEEKHAKMEAEDISFSCIVSGQPMPTVVWLKDGYPLLKDPMDYTINESLVTGFSEREEWNNTLSLSRLTREDSGVYKCRGENKVAQVDMDVGYALTVLESTPSKE